jgi:hypothetical protein
VGTLFHLGVLAPGNTLFGIDAFGWGVIIFLLLLFAIPYSRYLLRAADLKDWPITPATIRKIEVVKGAPRELAPPIANAVAHSGTDDEAGLVYPGNGPPLIVRSQRDRYLAYVLLLLMSILVYVCAR